MSKLKKIVLLLNSSNFEKENNIVTEMHYRFQRLGNYALYVLTNYGLFMNGVTPYDEGEAKIYDLLEAGDFDGCILEGNLIGNKAMLDMLAKRLKALQIPTVTLNYRREDFPCVVLDTYGATCQLLEHLIVVHGCSRINLVNSGAWDVVSRQSVRAYYDTLEKYGIPFRENRLMEMSVSIKNGQKLYDIFRRRGVDDAQAVICAHDVHAIGYFFRMKREGISVPEDVRLCSLNHSTNSTVFRPDIAGVDRQDYRMVDRACELIDAMLRGKRVERVHEIQGELCLGKSCGCDVPLLEADMKKYQDIILSKVENGNQIGQMMRYNDLLETVESLDAFGENIYSFLTGIRCKEFLFCINEEDMGDIMSTAGETPCRETSFSGTMVALTGYTEQTGKLKNRAFPLKELMPLEPRRGDLFLFFPVHNRTRVYGYTLFVNETLPVSSYNYRICHESLNSSIENLRRLMIQKQMVAQLAELHMRDAMTGLYNQFALVKYRDAYVTAAGYMMVVIDMDGLKRINDGCGHLSGDRAICFVADTLSANISEDDLLLRYGGDEFFILSKNDDEAHWRQFGEHVNALLAEGAKREAFPFPVGISIGYSANTETGADGLEHAIARADERMYENKKQRKAVRTA